MHLSYLNSIEHYLFDSRFSISPTSLFYIYLFCCILSRDRKNKRPGEPSSASTTPLTPLSYTTNPPHLQLLHCLRARSPGGSSLFSDAFHAATTLHTHSAFHFRTLCTFPVTYHYHNDAQHYHRSRPTLELFPYPKYSEPTNLALRRVNWSPPFQAPFEARIGGAYSGALANYRAAAAAFEALVSAQENVFEYRLEEGECVVFDNRRVLHARRAFDASQGGRWLKGAYVDDDVFFSRLRVLQERFEGRWTADGVVRHVVK